MKSKQYLNVIPDKLELPEFPSPWRIGEIDINHDLNVDGISGTIA
jgi:hypothetical protein